MAETAQTNSPSVKKYYDYAQQQIDEQAILDKYNAATLAQFNVQREQNRQAENQFYNQMYNTQRTAMDTIRQANAAAVSSGASRGMQAANELSALLGLQNESIASATELAQANRQTAQEETAAVIENVLNAYQQATQEKQQLVSQGIEAASVDAQQEANMAANMQAQAQLEQVNQAKRTAIQEAAVTSPAALAIEMQAQGLDFSKTYSNEGAKYLNLYVDSYLQKIANISDESQKTQLTLDYVDGLNNSFGISYEEIIKQDLIRQGINTDSTEGKKVIADAKDIINRSDKTTYMFANMLMNFANNIYAGKPVELTYPESTKTTSTKNMIV